MGVLEPQALRRGSAVATDLRDVVNQFGSECVMSRVRVGVMGELERTEVVIVEFEGDFDWLRRRDTATIQGVEFELVYRGGARTAETGAIAIRE